MTPQMTGSRSPVYLTLSVGALSGVLLVLSVYLPIFALVVPLPLLCIGLTSSVQRLVTAALSASCIVAVFTGGTGLGLFILTIVLPAIAIYLFGINRSGVYFIVRWGQTYAALACLTFGFIAIGSQVIQNQIVNDLRQDLIQLYASFWTMDQPQASQLADSVMALLPGTVSVSWILYFLFNVALAIAVTRRVSWIPPLQTQGFHNLRLPPYWDVMTGVFLLASYVPGLIGVLALYMSIVALLGLALVGLATTHTWIFVQLKNNRLFLIPLYLMVVFVALPMAVILIVIGLVDHITDLRYRLKKTFKRVP